MTITYQISDNQDASEIREMLQSQGVPHYLIEKMAETLYCEFRNFNLQVIFTDKGDLAAWKFEKC